MNNKYPMYLKLIKEIVVFIYGITLSILILALMFIVAFFNDRKLDNVKSVW